MHLGEVGWVLERNARGETQAKLLPRQVKYFKISMWQTHLAHVEVEVNTVSHLGNIFIRELHPL